MGKEGRLKQRMSLPGSGRRLGREADSINNLIDDLVRPTVDAPGRSVRWPRGT